MRRPSLTLSLLALAAALPLCAAASAQQAVRQSSRVVSAVDTQQRSSLAKHHLPAWAAAGNDLGAVADDISLDHLTVVLARSTEEQAAFEQLLTDQQDPSSPHYHQWLTPQQAGEGFGPTDHDLSAVIEWLASQGLRVETISPDRTRITFSGVSGTVGRALSTEFHRYNVSTVQGEQQKRLSINSEPMIPAALSPLIAGFHGLSEERLIPQSTTRSVSGPRPELTGTENGVTAHFVSPADFVKIYDIQPVYNGGFNGAGVKVAIAGQSQVKSQDITTFQTNTGLNASLQPVTIIPSTGADPGVVCTNTSCDQGEQTLDVNRVMATAPGAEADLVVSKASNTDDGLDIAIAYEVDTLQDPILTISYGGCEADATQGNANYYDGLFKTAAAAGITTFVSSGDSGVAGCVQGDTTPPATTPTASINLLCASQYVTCVGGTEFADTASPSTYWQSSNTSALESAISYIPEGAWNEPGSGGSLTIFATGGGPSIYIAKPSWQTGTGVPADSWRDTPDIALPASLHNGYYGCLTDYNSTGCTSTGTSFSFEIFGGTSAAAPAMAGIMALLEQKLGGPQGNFNPTLYRIANASTGVFHDATPSSSGVGSSCSTGTASMCNNSTPSRTGLTGGLAGYALTTGYDLATGWGSVDVDNLLAAVSSTYTLTPAAGTLTISTPGATTGNTFVVTATSVDSFAGTVPLSCKVVSNTGGGSVPTCSLSPNSVTLTANGTATTTVTINTTAASAENRSPELFGPGGVLACMLLCLPLASRKRKHAIPLLLALATIFAFCGGLSACGAGGTLPATAAGNYTVTVSGTVAGTVTSTSFPVTVN